MIFITGLVTKLPLVPVSVWWVVTQEAVVRSHGSGGHLATSPPLLLLVPGHRLECLTTAWASSQQTMGTSNPGPHLLQSEGGSFWSLPHALSLHCLLQLCLLHGECILYSYFNVLFTNPSPDPPSPVRPCTSLPLLFHHLALIDFPQPGSLGWPSSSGAVAGIIKMLLMMVAKPNPSMGSLQTSLRTVRTARRLRTSSEHHSSARLHLL